MTLHFGANYFVNFDWFQQKVYQIAQIRQTVYSEAHHTNTMVHWLISDKGQGQWFSRRRCVSGCL